MLKTQVRRAFNRAAESYVAAADVQRRVAAALADRVVLAATPALIVDAGCGTGFALPLLRRSWPAARIVALDVAERMLLQLRQDAGAAAVGTQVVGGDIERLPLANACADLYWSSFSLQWCELSRALAEARRVLRPGAALAFATVTSDTFHELRAAFAGIDEHPHTLDFLSPEAIDAAVAGAGFTRISLTRDRLQARYPDFKTLLRSVRQVGASGISGERRRGLLGKDAWRSIEAGYARFREGGRCPLTYDVLYVTACA